MRRAHAMSLQLLKLAAVCCAVLSLLAVAAEANLPALEAAGQLQRRSLPASAPPPPAPTAPTPTPLWLPTPANITAAPRPSDNRCQNLPITPETWKLLNIDNTLTSLRNSTIAEYAAANGADNFICGIGENCNAGQLCHPVKAPAWQILYATQEYTSFINALTDSINYALAQLQAVAASMAQDLAPNFTESQFRLNLEWLFTDMYRGIAYGATALLLVSLFASGVLQALFIAFNILLWTGISAGVAAWFQGAPHTASFVPWSKLSFYISQAQGALAGHITEATESILMAPVNSEHGLAKILADGHFFHPPSPTGIMQTTEQSILRVVQGRLLARLLRGQNAYVLISPDECKGKGPGGAREGNDVLSYCDPKEKLLYNVIRAHKKKTINSVYGGATVVNKYGFSVEYIVRNSWECQKKYGNFEHDVFADTSKLTPDDLMSEDCIINLPVCDMREDPIRNMKFSRHKTTTVACRRGGGLPI